MNIKNLNKTLIIAVLLLIAGCKKEDGIQYRDIWIVADADTRYMNGNLDYEPCAPLNIKVRRKRNEKVRLTYYSCNGQPVNLKVYSKRKVYYDKTLHGHNQYVTIK
jgi:hypothetical protein